MVLQNGSVAKLGDDGGKIPCGNWIAASCPAACTCSGSTLVGPSSVIGRVNVLGLDVGLASITSEKNITVPPLGVNTMFDPERVPPIGDVRTVPTDALPPASRDTCEGTENF